MDFSQELVQAKAYAKNDIKSTWHRPLRPKSHFDFNTFLCPHGSNWAEILESFPAQQVIALAPNNKEYKLCLLPYPSYVIRYLCVLILEPHLPFAWHSRYNAQTLSTKAKNSLLLSHGSSNQKKTLKWREIEKSQGKSCLRIDISNFFGSIDHQKLLELIKKGIKNPTPKEAFILEFLPQLLAVPTQGHGKLEKGLPIGNSPDRFFSNLYLDPIDQLLLQEPNISFMRYLDDIRLYGKALDKLVLAMFTVKEKAQSLYLELNPLKTGIVIDKNSDLA